MWEQMLSLNAPLYEYEYLNQDTSLDEQDKTRTTP
jgi:hypothetical protein